MHPTTRQIRAEVKKARETESNLKQGQFLETDLVRKISQAGFQSVKSLGKESILALCEELLGAHADAERLIAFDWAFRCRRQYAEADFARFEGWLERYVDSWGSCDDFCTHAFGGLIYSFPVHLPKLDRWAQAKSLWLRRAAAVVLIYSVRRKAHVEAAFHLADVLLTDAEDLVQKGYGWLLKETCKAEPRRVFDYVMQNKAVMPRTALRYAIEKLPPAWRKRAMARPEG
jgi:3-methyladenine DNA glycosylase AlkD